MKIRFQTCLNMHLMVNTYCLKHVISVYIDSHELPKLFCKATLLNFNVYEDVVFNLVSCYFPLKTRPQRLY